MNRMVSALLFCKIGTSILPGYHVFLQISNEPILSRHYYFNSNTAANQTGEIRDHIDLRYKKTEYILRTLNMAYTSRASGQGTEWVEFQVF